MNIDPLSNYGYTQNSHANKGPSNSPEPRKTDGGATERLSANLSSSVREIFASTPEIRPDVVERGRELLADPTYPPQNVVERIAALITPLSED